MCDVVDVRDRDISELCIGDCHTRLSNLIVMLDDAYVDPFSKAVLQSMLFKENVDGKPTTCGDVLFAAKQLFNEERMKVLEDCLDKAVNTYCNVGEDDDKPDFGSLVITSDFIEIFSLYFDEACHNMLMKYFYESEEYKKIVARLAELKFAGRIMFVCDRGKRITVEVGMD